MDADSQSFQTTPKKWEQSRPHTPQGTVLSQPPLLPAPAPTGY